MDKLWYSNFSDLFQETPTSDLGFWANPPYTVCMESTYRCNYQCKVCISNSGPQYPLRVRWIPDTLANIMRAFGPLRIVWSGGEPTLLNKIYEYLLLSKNLGNKNVLVSNASRFIPDLPVEWVDLSIYGYSDESFSEYTKTNNFKSHLNNIYRYAREYKQVSASFVLGIHQNEEIARMVDIAVEAGINRLKFHRLSEHGRFELDHINKDITIQVEFLQNYIDSQKVNATYTRTSSSNHKRSGYWVAKPYGRLTNCDVSIKLDQIVELRESVQKYSEKNKSLFSS